MQLTPEELDNIITLNVEKAVKVLRNKIDYLTSENRRILEGKLEVESITIYGLGQSDVLSCIQFAKENGWNE